MKVIIIGGGGREHTLAWKLSQSPDVEEVVCAPGNAGTARVGRNAPVSAEDIANLLSLAKEEKPGLVVVGPEAPLALGLVDELEALGIPAFGPSAEAARIEASKAFSKALMDEAGIPTAAYGVFEDAGAAKDFVSERGGAWAVKADGLAAGKGVLLCPDVPSTHAAISQIMEERAFGEAGDKCVVEEFLEGEEASFLAFADGETALPMASAQDHKAIGEGDTGPNTGGMGAYSPAPVLSGVLEERALETVIKPAIRAMARRGTPYKGILYAGLMVQGDELKVLEFNCRFGDPECQPLLTRMEGDLLPILMACVEGRLHETTIRYSQDAAVCVVMAAGGYPDAYRKGDTIHGIEDADAMPGVHVFHAGTALNDEDAIVTAGGRVIGVTARGMDIRAAIARAYEASDLIYWEDAYLRKDIGAKALRRLG
ncbi:MAG: phosphoribosylamine--glycine ligase [Nitrospinae bacterium]|nr:phosphoribosylamine--glycine ligase [Nitrospinota bacterium]